MIKIIDNKSRRRNKTTMNARRISVIGNAGGGKSTFSKALSRKMGIPHYAVDKWQWMPGWVYAGVDEIKRKQDEIIEEAAWIIDGWGPVETIEERFSKSDMIVMTDLPVHIYYGWTIKRQIKCLFGKEEQIEGCPFLPKTWEIIKMIRNIEKNGKAKLEEMIGKHKDRVKVVKIRKPKQYAELLSSFG